MRLVAKLMSFMFNPLVFLVLMPFLVVYKQTQSQLSAMKWGVFSFLFVALALTFVAFGRWKKVFSDFDLSKREERQKFYYVLWLLAFSYLTVALFFRGVYFYLSIAAVGIAFGIVLLTVVNRYVKASAHVAVATAFSITFFLLFREDTSHLVFLLILLVSWARIVLKRHTAYEVVAGGILGGSITIVTFLLGKYLYS